jgi:hypothetical protein
MMDDARVKNSSEDENVRISVPDVEERKKPSGLGLLPFICRKLYLEGKRYSARHNATARSIRALLSLSSHFHQT